MKHKIIVTIFLITTFGAEGQDYLEMMQNLYNASKARQITSAKISYTEEKEDELVAYSQFVYGDNRETPWRAIHRIEENETLFFDGLNTTYRFRHDYLNYRIDTGMASVIVFKNLLGTLTQIILARNSSGLSGLVENAKPKVVSEGNGMFNLVLDMPGPSGYNLTDKKTQLRMDSTTWTPLQFIDSVYFLERLVRIEENLDTIYSNHQEADSLLHQVDLWKHAYTLILNEQESEPKPFPYQEIMDELDFINHKPEESDFYLFDIYFVGCVACHQCLPLITALESGFSDRLSVIAINPVDKVEKIERFNRINNITSSSATIPKDFVFSIVGQLNYPTYILYDSQKNELLRATSCDPAFFEHVAQIISK